MSKGRRRAGGRGPLREHTLLERFAEQSELLGILSRENDAIGRIARHLSRENEDLRRLVEYQQRRIDGYEAEAFSLREVV